MDWYNADTPEALERLESAWRGAPIENVETLSMLLDVARIQVLAYAADDDEPALQVEELLDGLGIASDVIQAVLALLDFPTEPEPTARYVYAQLQQAKNLWNAGAANPNGDIGAEGYTFVPRPLDKTIRQIIRPTTGAASVF